MRKLLLSFLLLLSLPQMIFASNPGTLKDLLDDYNYSMTVEWDQKDISFEKQKQKEFEEGINGLISAGLTKEEVLLATGIDIGAVAAEVKSLNLSNSSDIAAFLKNHKQFKRGASWSGEVIVGAIGAAAIITFFAIIINKAVQINKRFDACVKANGGNENLCIDNSQVLGVAH